MNSDDRNIPDCITIFGHIKYFEVELHVSSVGLSYLTESRPHRSTNIPRIDGIISSELYHPSQAK